MARSRVSTVGVVVNPRAGKDIRRLVSGASHTSDATKVGIVRRVVAGALEQGVERVLVASDTHRLAVRAIDGLDGPIELVDSPHTGSHLDSVIAARELWKHEAGAAVVLGGDGTCRDVATGWPDVPLIPLSTGTNNVFPLTGDGSAAGVAAGLVATGAVDVRDVSTQAKRIVVHLDDPRQQTVSEEVALVEAALVTTTFVGARAVTDPDTIRWVVAAIADPAATGLASIAGRVHPIGRDEPGGVLVRLGPDGDPVRVPIAPGTFTTVRVAAIEPLTAGQVVHLGGAGTVAYDGERTSTATADTTITASLDTAGPRVIDVGATLTRAARLRMFDDRSRRDIHGD